MILCTKSSEWRLNFTTSFQNVLNCVVLHCAKLRRILKNNDCLLLCFAWPSSRQIFSFRWNDSVAKVSIILYIFEILYVSDNINRGTWNELTVGRYFLFQDMASQNQYDAGVAMNGLSVFITPDLARDLANDVMNQVTPPILSFHTCSIVSRGYSFTLYTGRCPCQYLGSKMLC